MQDLADYLDGLMVRAISWLHVSDIHIRVADTWSQDVVLASMCRQIARQRTEGLAPDFILVTGDLAFSGKVNEYKLVADFLEALSEASAIPRERIFCIPGNHDIDRDRQKMCFLGARTHLQSQNQVDGILNGGEDLEMLIQRQENFRRFQTSHFVHQERTRTTDGLAYVSRLTIEDVRLTIVGLDSAWLSQGGSNDHGKLIVGERQVINALQMVQEDDISPHVVIAMVHHPFHMLQEFDRSRVMSRMEDACHFLHCGHLHELEARTTVSGSAECLTLTAGPSYETRDSYNTYSVVTLDLLRGIRTVATHQYEPANGVFSFTARKESRIEVAPIDICSMGQLAMAMENFDPELAPWANYLSALLLEQKAELPVPTQNGYTFASFSVLLEQPESNLKRKTQHFLTFRNTLRVLYGRIPLSDILAQHGIAVAEYGALLRAACHTDAELQGRLEAQESDARQLAITIPATSSFHTSALLSELVEAQDWQTLREHALRHTNSNNPSISVLAKRMLALSLANSEEPSDSESAISAYKSLSDDGVIEASDLSNLVILLCNAGSYDEAKQFVVSGIKKFPRKAQLFAEVGQRIITATGDKKFRVQLEIAIGESEDGD